MLRRLTILIVALSVSLSWAPAAFAQELNDAVATFVVDRNEDNFANALVQAVKESQSRK